MQVLHQSILPRLSYRRDGRTDRQTDGFSALYSKKKEKIEEDIVEEEEERYKYNVYALKH